MYDTWKLATPPCYDQEEREDEAQRREDAHWDEADYRYDITREEKEAAKWQRG